MLPSPKYVANFRLRNRFFRGERWIHTGRKWVPSSAPLAEKRPGGETGGENGWIFLFFWLLYIVSTFYILHLCILHSPLMHFIFCIPHLCILHFWRMYHVKNILHRCILHSTFLTYAFCILHLCKKHSRRMHHVKNILHWCILYSAFLTYAFCISEECMRHYKMHVYNVTRILNCILITIQLYTTPTPVSIVTDILLLYNNL